MSDSHAPAFDGRIVLKALRWAAVLILLACAAGSLGFVYWRLELATHWLPQIALASALCGVILAATREWMLVALLAGSTALAGVQVAPWMTTVSSPEPSSSTFTVFYANVLRVNTDADSLAAQIVLKDPDLVVLVEVDERWLKDLDWVLADYPLSLAHPLDDNFGVALCSRLPMDSAELSYFGPEHPLNRPGIVASIRIQNTPVQVYAVHTMPPVASEFAAHRDLQLQDIGDRISTSSGAAVVVGDLNTTMYARGHTDLVGRSGLRNAREGRGPLGTWPAGFPAWLRIPIDHVLVSKELQVTSLEVGEQTGSDHLPLIVGLCLTNEEQHPIQEALQQ